MTCNLYWDEIVEQLLPGQMPQDRLDIVERVYRAKLRDLHDFLLKTSYRQGCCMGPCHIISEKGDYHLNTSFWLRKTKAKYEVPMIMTNIYQQNFLIRRSIPNRIGLCANIWCMDHVVYSTITAHVWYMVIATFIIPVTFLKPPNKERTHILFI